MKSKPSTDRKLDAIAIGPPRPAALKPAYAEDMSALVRVRDRRRRVERGVWSVLH